MRTRWSCIAFGLLMAGMAANAQNETPYHQTRNIVYAEPEGVALVMDIFAPIKKDGPGHGIGLVCVISGAWKSDRGMVEAYRKIGYFDILCSHGYTVFAVRPGSYSLFTAEEMLAHIDTGIRYIKAHAAKYGVDPNKLGLTGVSAGGHLACLAGTRWEPGDPKAADPLARFDTRVSAVGVFCPATDFLDWDGKKYGLDLMNWQLAFRCGVAGKTEAQKKAAARAISPVYYVKPGLPPFLVIVGDADSVIPWQQSRKLVETLQKAGDSAKLIVKHGGDHTWPKVQVEIGKLANWFDGEFAHPALTN